MPRLRIDGSHEMRLTATIRRRTLRTVGPPRIHVPKATVRERHCILQRPLEGRRQGRQRVWRMVHYQARQRQSLVPLGTTTRCSRRDDPSAASDEQRRDLDPSPHMRVRWVQRLRSNDEQQELHEMLTDAARTWRELHARPRPRSPFSSLHLQRNVLARVLAQDVRSLAGAPHPPAERREAGVRSAHPKRADPDPDNRHSRARCRAWREHARDVCQRLSVERSGRDRCDYDQFRWPHGPLHRVC